MTSKPVSYSDTAGNLMRFMRDRTLGTLESIEKLPDPKAALAWRPGPGRANAGWQLVHIGITEELFACERLAQRPVAWPDLVPRFRGGSKPDEDVPAPAEIRRILSESRDHLFATLSDYGDERLDEIPPALAERGWNMRTVLGVLVYHEAHHQGQTHLTINLYKAAQGL